MSYNFSHSQCDTSTPFFNVDLSTNSDSVWNSPSVQRNGNCCGTSSPNVCISFLLTLASNAQGIVFDVCDGALPPGALFYQVDCGPQQAVGNVLCLSGNGPFLITFCKPGNNQNQYCITSLPLPGAGPDLAVNDGCIDTLSSFGFQDTSIIWTSVFPGPNGAYDTLLSCTQDCDSTVVTGGNNLPTYIDYQVCGTQITPCTPTYLCDTVRVFFFNTLNVDIFPENPTVCFGQVTTWIKASTSGGSPPYSLLWSTGSTSDSIQVGVGTYTVQLSDNSGCPPTFDTIVVTEFLSAIEARAGNDSIICSQNFPFQLNGSVIAASGGRWSGGLGSFSPNDSTLNATYLPSAMERANGNVQLILNTTGNGSCPPDMDTVEFQFQAFTATTSHINTNVSCNGGSDGTSTTNLSNGNPPFTFLWDANAGSSNSNSLNNLSAGVYFVTITNSLGCSFVDSVTITEPPVLTSIISSSVNVSCNGRNDGTATVSASGGTNPYTYAWPSGTTTANETGLSQGTYVVTVTDAKSCTSTSSVNITEPTLLTSSISASSNVSCNGGSDGTATVSASGGTTPYAYTWPSGTTTANETGLTQGTYVVTVTDAKSCTTTSSISITEPSVLTSAIGSSTNVSCNGGNNGTATASGSGGTTPYSYAWPSGTTTANETGLAQGTYVVTVTDAKSCTSIDSVTITEPTLLTSSISASTNVSCNGAANGTATVSASGGTTPYSYSWPSGTTTANETGLAQGTYVVTVTDAKSCTSVDSVTITRPSVLTSSIGSSTNVSCNGGNNGTATASASGGTTPYSYAWPSGTTTANETGLTQGTYVVTVTDAKSCTSTSSVNITEPALLTSSISASTNVSCNGGSNGTATVSASGGTTPYSYAWPSGTTTSNEVGLAQGTYVVTVTDAKSCTTTSSISITEPSVLNSIIGSSTNVSCNGGNDGTATASGSGGTTPYSYAWPSGTTTANETGLAQGTYVVTVTDANSCTSVDSVTITEPTLLTSSISASSNVSCNGGTNGTATVSASGGTTPYAYAWPSGTTTASETGLAQGTYVVTVTDAKSCTSTSSVTITQPSALNSSIGSSTNVSCNGGNDGTATVSASGGTTPYSYTWPSGTTTANETGLTQGTYVVTVTDAKSCTSTSSVNITEPALLTSSISASSNVSCNGGSNGTATVSASGGTTPYSYAWPSGTTTANEVGLAQGTYVVTVTDAKSCTTTSSISITEPSVLNSTIGSSTNVSCNGGNDGTATASGSGGTTPYSYAWPSGTTTANETGLAQGTYVVTVTDANSCTSVDSVTITEPTLLTSSISASSNVSCNGGTNGTATVSASGGTTPYAYAWPSGTTTASETGLAQGTYVVTVTDAKSCTSTSTVNIFQPDSLNILTGVTPVSCFGLADGELIVTPRGGTAPYSFNWSNNVIDSINPSLIAGTYQITVTDANGCTLDSALTIQEPDSLILMVSQNDTICIGNSITIQATVTGGNSIFTYNWNNSLSNASSHTVSPISSTIYTVNVTDEKGCFTNQDSIRITVRDLSKDSIQAFSNGNICFGDTTIIYATHNGAFNNYSYTWNNNAGNGLGPISVSPSSTTIYTINTTDICGNVIADSVEVIVENYPLVSLPSVIKSGCEPLDVVFEDTLNGVSNNYSYLWNLGDGTTSTLKNLVHTYNNAGQYDISLKVTASGGCESNSTSQSQVIVYSNPVASFTINPSITDLNNPNVSFSNTSLNTDNVKWDFYNSFYSFNNDTTIQFIDTGWFSVKLVASNIYGCADSTTKQLRINPVYELKIPNAFTPNSNGSNGGFYGKNDLSNDVFYVHSDLVANYEMLIFNRWGELIFQTRDINRGWDGYYLGKLSPQDVYVYKVTVQWLNGKKETKTGNFTLFR